MTDKERLETIKELVKKIESILYDEWRQQELTNLIESLYYDDHVDWLLNRIEELEKELNKQMNIGLKFEGEANELQKQNKRYREALEFYAEPENYCVTFEKDYEPILKDNGKIARRALKGETK